MFVLNYKFINGASLLALAKSIYYSTCFVFNLLTDGTLQLPETNLAFAISATGTEAKETHEFIKDIIKSIITTYGTRKLQYSVIVYGDSVSPEVTFGNIFKSDADLIKAIDSIPRVTGSPSFDKALEEAKEQLMSPFLRPYAAKVGSLHCDLVFTYPYIFEKIRNQTSYNRQHQHQLSDV